MIQPLRKYLLIEPRIRQLSSRLWTDNRENLCNGYVRQIGSKVTEVQIGDFVAYGGEEYLKWPVVYDDGHKYQLITEADVCCVVEGE